MSTHLNGNSDNNHSRPLKIFISYAPADDGLAMQLEEHLALLKRKQVVESWNSRKVSAGEVWLDQIRAQLEEADLVVLLVSAAFLASEQNYTVEMAYALDQHRGRRVQLLPVLVRACDYMSAPFSRFKMLPADGVPIAAAQNRDVAWAEVVGEIRRAASPANQTSEVLLPPRPSCEDALQLIRTLLPRLLAATAANPRTTLLRAGVQAPVSNASNQLDEWTLICDWIARAGQAGFVHTFKLINEIQESHFSDGVSDWAATFIETLLRGFGVGGGGDSDLEEEVKRQLKGFVGREAERWEELRRRVQKLTLPEESLDYITSRSELWSRATKHLVDYVIRSKRKENIAVEVRHAHARD